MAHSTTINLPPTECIVAALTALRLGSFSAAAIELGVTHAAVSRRVGLLEDWMGVELFRRHGRGVHATTDGQRVLARLSVATSQICELPRTSTRRNLPNVRVAVTPAFARYWLLPRLPAIEGKPADLRVEVIADLMHADLAKGEADLAIRYGKGGWGVGIEHRLFDEESMVPIASQNILTELGGALPSDIAAMPLLHAGDRSNWSAWLEIHSSKTKAKATDRVMADYGLAMDATTSGLGVALWNTRLHQLDHSVVPLLKYPVSSALHYYILARSSDTRSPASVAAGRLMQLARSG